MSSACRCSRPRSCWPAGAIASLRRELLIAAGPGEWRAAWLEDGVAAELHVERGDTSAGRQHPSRPGGAAGRRARRGAGRYRRRAPRVPAGARRRRDGSQRGRARGRAGPARGAARQRRAAVGPPRPRAGEAICADRRAAAKLDPPAQLDPAPGFAAALALRLPASRSTILPTIPAVLPELRGAFAAADIAHRRDRGMAGRPRCRCSTPRCRRRLALAGGGSVHIEETRAAVLIDVDTGSPETGSAERTALAVNLAAAAAIARQLRLRQLGGGIVVDFAALEGRRPRERVRQAMTAALAGDPARPQVLGWTRLGHLEIVRPRRLRPLSRGNARTARRRARAPSRWPSRHCARCAARPAPVRRRIGGCVVAPAVAAALRGPPRRGCAALEDAARPHRSRSRSSRAATRAL